MADEAGQARRARWAVPVWVLVVLLAAVPTSGMLVLAVQRADASADAAAAAAQVRHRTEGLVALTEVLFALAREQVPSQAVAQAAEFGLSASDTSEILGVDLEDDRAAARTRTDRAVAALPDAVRAAHPEVGDLEGQLAALRAVVDDPTSPAAPIESGYRRLVTGVGGAVAAERDGLEDPRTAVAPDVRQALGALVATTTAFTTGVDEMWALARVLFAPDDPATASGLAQAHEAHQRARADLDAVELAPLDEQWRSLASSPELGRFDAVVVAATRDPASLTADGLPAVADVFGASFARSEGLAGLVASAGDRAIEASATAQADAEADERRAVALAAGLGVLTVTLGAVLSLSITRPLHRLARGAAAVREGRLDDAHFEDRGPREVRAVAETMEEAVANLRQVATQADALAAGRLDDEVLARALPSPLGESLHASVGQLSTAMRDQEALRRQLEQQAHLDGLTGLPNRAGSLAAADGALSSARRGGHLVALLFVDLDDFKRVNDTLGHAAGDHVLRTTGERLRDATREGDTVGRIGGDEFVVVADPVASLDDALALGHRLVAAASAPLEVDGRWTRIGASVGIALDPDGDRSASDLLREADQAVYRAKRSGRGRVEVFDDHLRHALAERNELERLLADAIAADDLEVHYQPILRTADRTIRGVEALARWSVPGRGPVPAEEFVAVAETSDLIVELDRWVLGRALADAGHLAARGWPIQLSVNLSARHLLAPSVVEDVTAALARAGAAAGRLTLEVTETVLVEHEGSAIAALGALRRAGVRIALDDFGTGYTSIAQLGRLPVDSLKIDRQFVAGLDQPTERSIVELIVGVAHTLGLDLVAEGVERDDQLEVLDALGCDAHQGFLDAEPVPLDALLRWLEDPSAAGGPGRPEIDRVG